MYSKLKKNLLLMPIDCEERDVTQIEDKLFLGNIEFAQNHHSMTKNRISLVVAVYPKHLINLSVQLIPHNCRYHHIDAKDVVFEDLISHFDLCYELIDEELRENDGSVLVYCGAGFSRSVTIVSAYLMRKYRISSEEAVQRIRDKRHKINPNHGFLAQLKLYEQMEFRVDKTNPEYRSFVLFWLKKQVWTEKYWENTPLGAMERQFCSPMQAYRYKLSDAEHRSQVNYHCAECSHKLFDEINVVSISKIKQSVLCDKLFLEPMQWMTRTMCANQKGDIACPQCAARLGQFKWKAFKCHCILHNGLKDSRIIRIDSASVVRCEAQDI